jgi:LCP family protein required for cell wall assembly
MGDHPRTGDRYRYGRDGRPRDDDRRYRARPGRGGRPAAAAVRKRPKDPLWARLVVAFGVVTMVISGLTVAVPKLLAAWFTSNMDQIEAIPTELIATSIDGPINFLLLGLDQREGEEAEDRIRADSIVLLHIPAAHDVAYMISIPRDSGVEIPAYPATKYGGGFGKINSAFAYGAVTPDIYGDRDATPAGWARGADLMMRTISNLVPGGLKFNGVAIINFAGFEKVVEALGTIKNFCVDEEVHSIHYYPDGTRAFPDLNYTYGDDQTVGKHYPLGCYDMQPWEALDYSRQRYGLSDGDYGRQRHQQQLLKAIVRQVMQPDVFTNLSTIRKLQQAAGDLLTPDFGGFAVEDWVLTLSSLRADDIIMIKTNGGKFTSTLIDGESFEFLSDETMELLRHVQSGTVLDFLTRHPDWIATG